MTSETQNTIVTHYVICLDAGDNFLPLLLCRTPRNKSFDCGLFEMVQRTASEFTVSGCSYQFLPEFQAEPCIRDWTADTIFVTPWERGFVSPQRSCRQSDDLAEPSSESVAQALIQETRRINRRMISEET
jgi:hypothetical protein